MKTFESFASSLNSLNEGNFEDIALKLFQFQALHNPVYHSYLQFLKIDPKKVNSITQIPFLPISLFKTHSIKTNDWQSEATFLSSGTTAQNRSRHEVWSMSFYLKHARKTFESQFGSLSDYHIVALLPSYLERQGSSLIAMVDHFIKATHSAESGFYLYNHSDLLNRIENLKSSHRKTILWGVSFALLDLAETGPHDLHHCMIFETGGMKGRRKELIREEFHDILKRKLNAGEIYSEYGMTELMSQGYSMGKGYFTSPSWMKIIIRDVNDPFELGLKDQTGGINVIDLANFHSCAFIETQDLGRVSQDGSFEVIGRFDNSDIRGCNLLI